MKILEIKPIIMKNEIHTFYIDVASAVEDPNKLYSDIGN